MSATRESGGRLQPVPIDEDLIGTTLVLTEAAARATEALLKVPVGDDPHERAVYLAGFIANETSVATTTLAPRIESTRGSFRLHLEDNRRVVEWIDAHDLVVVGQVHTHPGNWVDHSDGDDAWAIVRCDGFWSLVVPQFGVDGIAESEHIGVHVFRRGAFWRLSPQAVAARLRIVPNAAQLGVQP